MNTEEMSKQLKAAYDLITNIEMIISTRYVRKAPDFTVCHSTGWYRPSKCKCCGSEIIAEDGWDILHTTDCIIPQLEAEIKVYKEVENDV